MATSMFPPNLHVVDEFEMPVNRLWFVDVVIKPEGEENAVIKHYGVLAFNKTEALAKVSKGLLPAHASSVIGINCIVEAVNLIGEDNASTE